MPSYFILSVVLYLGSSVGFLLYALISSLGSALYYLLPQRSGKALGLILCYVLPHTAYTAQIVKLDPATRYTISPADECWLGIIIMIYQVHLSIAHMCMVCEKSAFVFDIYTLLRKADHLCASYLPQHISDQIHREKEER